MFLEASQDIVEEGGARAGYPPFGQHVESCFQAFGA